MPNSKTISVQISVPITLLDIEVNELTPEAVLNAVATDLRNLESINEWEATWEDLKSAVRSGEAQIINEDYAVIR
tara:strand:- start:276 stop:500 length:225 start_codon:yes stop_codon:yes gene_type:complete